MSSRSNQGRYAMLISRFASAAALAASLPGSASASAVALT
jgi:hypothetical protein